MTAGRRHRRPHPRQLPDLRLGGANAYAIVDSGHGFKLLAIGRLAADEIVGRPDPRLEPFRLARFARGETARGVEGAVPVDVAAQRPA